jgi:hypothetical protein
VPAIPSWLLEPLWDQFAALLPDRPVYDPAHPLGCHRRRIGDPIIFEKLIQVLLAVSLFTATVFNHVGVNQGHHPGSDSDRILIAQLTGSARHHARWRVLTQDEQDAAVTELRELAGGRADLLAEVAGIFEGARTADSHAAITDRH